MEIKIIETVTTTKETSLIDAIINMYEKDFQRYERTGFRYCMGYYDACQAIVKLLKENELILK